MLEKMVSYVDFIHDNAVLPSFSHINEKSNVWIEYPVILPFDPDQFVNLYMGRHSYFQTGTISPNVVIGRYCSIAKNVSLGASQHDFSKLTTGLVRMDANTVSLHEQEDYTVIGSDVWIGLNAVIMSGVKIGTGAVIGAGAIVTKDVPPYAIVAGVPAKVMRYRFDDETVVRLLRSKWWELQPDVVEKMPIDDIQACLNFLKV